MKLQRKMICFLLVMVVFVSVHRVEGKKGSELMEISEFAGADPEARLDWVNKKLESKEFTSSDISSDLMTRLIMDVLVKQATAKDQMTKYGEIRGKYTKLVSTYELEKYLAMQYLATVPEAMNADAEGKCKIIHGLHTRGVLSWPGIADVLTGMMVYHLATDKKYQDMTSMQKIDYLTSLEGLKVVSNMTSSQFSKCVAAELISGTPKDKQPELINEINAMSDFFTKSSVQKGYLD
ncbi:MAG: hypothetical protein WBM02_11070 [bacterium]